MLWGLLAFQLYAEDVVHLGSEGDVLKAPVKLAAVGNLDTGTIFTAKYSTLTLSLLDTIKKSASSGIVLLGDIIQSTEEKAWSQQLTVLSTQLNGLPMLVLPGSQEYGQKELTTFGKSFGETKQQIGFNRTAGWQHLKIKDGKQRWTLLFLDSHKGKMGTKWKEQKRWLAKVLEGNTDEMVVFFVDSDVSLQHRSKASSELMSQIYDATGLSQVRLVVFSGEAQTQAILPQTTFDPLYLGCGGGGRKGKSLLRKNKEFSLHPMLDAFYLQALEDNDISEKTKDMAYSRGKFEGKKSIYDAKEFPTYGYCSLAFDNGLKVSQYHTLDGQVTKQSLLLAFTKVKGWTIPPKEEPQKNQTEPE